MRPAADGGGGASSLVVDHATLDAVAQGLSEAGSALDGAGSGRPAAGGTGLAEPLLLTILAGVSDAAARVSFESSTLAAIVEDCNAVVTSADQVAAESMLVDGFTTGAGGEVAAVAADLNTEIEGVAANIRAVATWLRSDVGAGLGDLGDAVTTQRSAASGDWQGEAGTAFASRAQTLVKAADGAETASGKAADSVGVLATALDRAQGDMAAVRGRARGGGLVVDGMWVRNPGSGPPSAGPSPAADAPAGEVTRWEQADQAVRDHNAKVEVWNGCVTDADAASSDWQEALETAARDWKANDSTLIGLTGQLLGASVQIELIRRTTPVLTADVDEMLNRASQLRQHAASMVDDAGRVADPGRYYDLLDEAADLEHAHPGARGGLPNWELPKGLTRGLWAIDVATAGFGIYSDIQDGESPAQAVTSNAVPAVASILAGTASGAAIGGAVGTFIPIPGVGTAAGVVVGAAVGTVVGAFTSGAIDSLWESGADSLGDWGNAAMDGVEEIGDTFSAAGDFAGDVVGSIF